MLGVIFNYQTHIWQFNYFRTGPSKLGEPKGAERLRCERKTFSNTLFVVALFVDKEFVIYFIFKRSIKQLIIFQ